MRKTVVANLIYLFYPGALYRVSVLSHRDRKGKRSDVGRITLTQKTVKVWKEPFSLDITLVTYLVTGRLAF